MKPFTDVGVSVLQVVLLAQVCSSAPRPHLNPNCRRFQAMIHKVGQLQELSGQLLRLMESELGSVELDEYRLDHLPTMEHTALHSLTLNESLSELYVDLSLFKQHVDWLGGAREDVGLSALSAEDAAGQQRLRDTGRHLKELTEMTHKALRETLRQEVPPPPSPSLPDAPHTFSVLHYSAEIAERLKVYCDWSKRVLRRVGFLSRCPGPRTLRVEPRS